jgi:hypothetical protein
MTVLMSFTNHDKLISKEKMTTNEETEGKEEEDEIEECK